MKKDSLMIFILCEILDSVSNHNPQLTTWELAKKYVWEDSPNYQKKANENSFLSVKTKIIKDRLKAMAKEGIVKIKQDKKGKDIFIIDGNRVHKGISKLPDGNRRWCLWVKEQNQWFAFQL